MFAGLLQGVEGLEVESVEVRRLGWVIAQAGAVVLKRGGVSPACRVVVQFFVSRPSVDDGRFQFAQRGRSSSFQFMTGLLKLKGKISNPHPRVWTLEILSKLPPPRPRKCRFPGVTKN